jgi:hypothetical protein
MVSVRAGADLISAVLFRCHFHKVLPASPDNQSWCAYGQRLRIEWSAFAANDINNKAITFAMGDSNTVGITANSTAARNRHL